MASAGESSASANTTGGVKRFMPNGALSAEEQRHLNTHLFASALANEPDLVIHYLSEGANPSSRSAIPFGLLPDHDIAPNLQNHLNRIAPDHLKFSSMTEGTTENVCALTAAVINCSWKSHKFEFEMTVHDILARMKSTAAVVARIVKVLLDAGANASQRSSFVACHLPGHEYITWRNMTPLDFVMQLQIDVRKSLGGACATELQGIIDLLRCPANDWVATIDRESNGSIHHSTISSLRRMLDSASETFSDIVFDCAPETAASSSEVCASSDLRNDAVSDLQTRPKRAKKSAAASSASSSSEALSLDSSAAASSSAETTLVHAHRFILCASSPYFRALFSGAWRDVSDGRIVAKQGARTIRRMLEFIYTGEMTAAKALQLPFEELIQLHEASAEYQIDALRAMTEAALAQQVSASNLVRMLQLAILHDGTSCALEASTAPASASSSSSSSSASSSLSPCMVMNACVAILKADATVLANDDVADFLASQPKLRAFVRTSLAKKH